MAGQGVCEKPAYIEHDPQHEFKTAALLPNIDRSFAVNKRTPRNLAAACAATSDGCPTWVRAHQPALMHELYVQSVRKVE